MFDIQKLKTFAFGGMAIAMVWFGFVVKGKSDHLEFALQQIDSARVLIHSAQMDIGSAKTDIDAAREQLASLRLAATNALTDLSRLKEEREKIHRDINNVLQRSQDNLDKQQSAIQEILKKQKALLDTISRINIDNVIIEPSKRLIQ